MNKEKEIKYCPQCGAPNKEDSLFCENCGFEFKKKLKKERPPIVITFGFLGVICILLLNI